MEGKLITEDLLGFCTECIRMRWLRVLDGHDDAGNPFGTCRTCAREAAEDAELVGHAQDARDALQQED